MTPFLKRIEQLKTRAGGNDTMITLIRTDGSQSTMPAIEALWIVLSEGGKSSICRIEASEGAGETSKSFLYAILNCPYEDIEDDVN